jgi:RNA polymerase II subunit A small phosphatase-like protein
VEPPLLVLDLDETLIYGTDVVLSRKPDFQCSQYHVYRRPYLNEFLVRVKKLYRLAVWTSSTAAYTDCILSHAFPADVSLEFTWARERCTSAYDPETHGRTWVKDLKKLKAKGYSLDRVLVIDDTPTKLQRNYGNLVRVSEWIGDSGDEELLQLGEYLESIHQAPSFRGIEKRGWRSRNLKSDRKS